MPLDLLVNGKELRVFPTKEYKSFKITKHSQIEIMDWKFYMCKLKKINLTILFYFSFFKSIQLFAKTIV